MTEPLLMQKLGAQLNYLTERQGLLSQNIANIDTPDYQAKDLKKVNFNDLAHAEAGKLALLQTSGKHLSGSTANSGHYAAIKDASAEEKKPLGNNIVLEDQMGKISDVGAQHQLTTTLMHKFNQLYRTAVESHGG